MDDQKAQQVGLVRDFVGGVTFKRPLLFGSCHPNKVIAARAHGESRMCFNEIRKDDGKQQ